MAAEDVVISGVGGHFPECDNMQEFQEALFAGTEVITDNAERWKPGRLGLTAKTGKVSGIEKFDTVFFGMHRKLTDATDPMSRVLMERVFEAIVDAGLNPVVLRGTRTAVFIGSALSESENIFIQTTAENGFGIMGHNRSMMANRVSYYFDFKGPSYALDTSFCSGMSALELGKRAIECGECDNAIVGTATLSFHPEITQHFHDLGQICADGVTKPFHKDGNGWVRSEAAICMLLQRRSAAHRVYASVEYVKVKKHSEGHQAPLLVTDPRHFANHLTEFYDELFAATGITADDIAYLEAEGSGFKPRDEAEVAAVDAGLCSRRTRPLPMGSIMGQFGHSEASSGLTMLSKLLVALDSGVIPATRNVTADTVNPALRAVVEGRLQLVLENTPLPGPIVAMNNFGVANLFSHVVLRANPREKAPPRAEDAAVLDVAMPDRADGGLLRLEPIPKIVFVSARNEDALNNAVAKLHAVTRDDPEYARLLQDVYGTHIQGHLQRAYTFLPKTEGLPFEAAPHGGARRPVWFIYAGMGSQWTGMARHLLRLPVFRRAVQRCHDALAPHGVNLLHIITSEDKHIYDNILHSFVGIAAVQVGLTDVLHALGVRPDGIIGHSVGELGCGYADGCFTAEQMVLAAHARGRASIETELIRGTMAAVGLGYDELKDMLPESIEVACRNSKTSSTISGPAEDMQRFVQQLKDKGVFARAVNVSNIAYHSRYIAPAGPKLLALLRDVLPEPRPRSARWVSTSVLEERWGEPLARTSSAEYHTNNLLSPVYFAEGSRKIPKDAICIEIAPHGLLQAILRRSLDAAVTNVPLASRDAPDGAVFLMQAIGKLYLAGLNPNVYNLYDPIEYPVSRGTGMLSPLVDWDHSETWYTGRYCQQTQFIPAEKHIPIRALDPAYNPYREMTWAGRSVVTPAVVLEKVVAMIYRINDEEAVPVVFEDVHFYNIVDMPVVEAELVYVLYQRGSGHFEVSKDMRILATGRAFVQQDGVKGMAKLWSSVPPTPDDEERVVMDEDEVYDELQRKGLKVTGKLRAIRQVVVSPSGATGRVANRDSHMLLLDTLLQLCSLMDAERTSELRVPRRVRRVIVDSDRSWLCADAPEGDAVQEAAAAGEVAKEGKVAKKVHGPLLDELVFRMHHSTETIRCANIEVQGVRMRPYAAHSVARLAVDVEQFVRHGDRPAPLQHADEFVSAALQLAGQQMALHPLCRQSTETLVGVLDEGCPLYDALREGAKRFGTVLVRRVTPQGAAACDLLVAADAALGYSLLAPHAVLLAVQPPGAPPAPADAAVLLRQTLGSLRLALYKKPQPATGVPSHVVEVRCSSQLAGMEVPPAGITYLVWRSMPDQSIPVTVKDYIRVLPGAHRIRCVFLFDLTAPKFSPTHPFYASHVRLGLAVSVLQEGAWGSLYLRPKQLRKVDNLHKDLQLSRLASLPDLKLQFIGLNSTFLEPTNLEAREGHILDIKWAPQERQPRGPGLLDYSGTSGSESVMGLMDAETLTVDPIMRWRVPDGWSPEDAVTVPYAYATAILALQHKALLRAGETVLVHDGWSALGQAAVGVALSMGCPVFTTYRCEEERGLLLRRFPALPPRNVVLLGGESFEHGVGWNRRDRHYNRGIHVILSTLGREGLLASLRSIAKNGRIVQLNTDGTAGGADIGMSAFMKSINMYGMDAAAVAHCTESVRRDVHAMVQRGLDAGHVRPIDRLVLPASDAGRAVGYLDGDCTDKVVLEVAPAEPAPAPGPGDGRRFECDSKLSYLVVGGDRSHALHTVDWLLSRGARHVLLAGLPDAAMTPVTLRRLALMRARWGAHLTTVPGARADTAQGASTLVSRAANAAPLAAVFVLPSATWQQDEAVQALDGVLRGPRAAVLLVALELSTPSGSVAAACDARRRAGARTALVAVSVAEPHLRVLALENALAEPQPVLHVSTMPADRQQATFKERLAELLPRSPDALAALGRTVVEARWRPRASLLTTCFGGPRVKSYEVPPLFLVAGLSDAPEEEMKPLALKSLANAVLLSPGDSKADTRALAADLVAEVLARQPQGPYTLTARGWAGCVVLEMARLLERRGERVAVMLLDCALQDLQDAVWALGQGGGLQAWLLCSLLHLPTEAYDALEALPSWTARLEHGLDLARALGERRDALAAGLDIVHARLCALAEYDADFTLAQTVITLIRPRGALDDDYRGLDKMSALPVMVVVSNSDLGTADFWTDAARAVSRGIYTGSKPMHLSLVGKTQSDSLWHRLR